MHSRMSISLWLSGFWVCALNMFTRSLAILPLCNSSGTIPGAVSQFTGPSSGICLGDDVTFTCVEALLISPPGQSTLE